MAKQPLGEVFGFPIDNLGAEAGRYRENRLCPFNNKVPSCTKDKASAPLGVCSVLDAEGKLVITCPVRFRQGWIIAEDAASFFFPKGTKWTTLTEVSLRDAHGKSAGNIDVVLVAYNELGKVTDFGALEVQAVYISGNVRSPFEVYMENPEANATMDWSRQKNYPNADYLSSSRKRLAPQLIFKGGILKTWGKKTTVALNTGFFETLPELEEVPREEADVAWMVYDLVHNESTNTHVLTRHKQVYTKFNESLEKITRSTPGEMQEFVAVLQSKVNDALDNPPDSETIDATF